MKNCYQLVFITNDNEKHDVIFSSFKKANEFLNEYKEGTEYRGTIIIKSFISKRILF